METRRALRSGYGVPRDGAAGSGGGGVPYRRARSAVAARAPRDDRSLHADKGATRMRYWSSPRRSLRLTIRWRRRGGVRLQLRAQLAALGDSGSSQAAGDSGPTRATRQERTSPSGLAEWRRTFGKAEGPVTAQHRAAAGWISSEHSLQRWVCSRRSRWWTRKSNASSSVGRDRP